MKLPVCLTFSLAMTLGASTAFGQTVASDADEATPATITTPVAFVYVQSGASHVYGFATAANGQLNPIPGSPFNYAVSPQAVNGKYLFGVRTNRTTIDSYLMESTGALQHVASLNTKVYDPHACSYVGSIRVDHSGQNLYNVAVQPDCPDFETTVVQSFKIDHSNGHLDYLAVTTEDDAFGGVDVFLGNNQYAYATDLSFYEGAYNCGIDIYKRPPNGELDNLGYVGMDGFSPPANPGGTYYCPKVLAADPANHLAMLMEQSDLNGGVYGKMQIGVFTVDTHGNLNTTSTYHSMPVAKTVPHYGDSSMRMAPSGKLLAVGGVGGLEIFHFNGANPATEFAVLLPNESIGELYWDNNNHLYVEVGTNKLYVYTITPTSIAHAPGSPYTIPSLGSMIVQPK